MIKRMLVLGCAILALGGTAKADKGMWLLNELSQENLEQMKELGFQLTPDSLYSLSKPSVASSVVIFGRGCTGVTVSGEGLIMTNHHCGFDAIQSQSSVDHDYLRDGFVSQTFAQELPIEGLEVRYLNAIKDVTADILKALNSPKDEADRIAQIQEITEAMIKAENKKLKNAQKEVVIRSYYAGNKYYMVTHDVYSDVRLVFAPPSSVGKFGGDTDNWMWPRHTGDFAVFRVYAGKGNKPARYAKTNVPMKPKYFASVSVQGYKKGDYAMTIGFPGSTERYIPSWGIENRMENENAPRIEVRGIKQGIWREAMDVDQATRIKYASKYAYSSNYWKNSIGMNRGIKNLKVLERKAAEEVAFGSWAKGTEYEGVLADLEATYKGYGTDNRQFTYLVETMIRGTEIVSIGQDVLAILGLKGKEREEAIEELKVTYKDYLPSLDSKVLPAMLELVRKHLPQAVSKHILGDVDTVFGGDYRAYAEALFAQTVLVDEDRLMKILVQKDAEEKLMGDPALSLAANTMFVLQQLHGSLAEARRQIARGNRLYFAGRQKMDPKRPMPSDANFTMRLSYGSISGYSPSDAVEYDYFTTPRGILEKYTPGSTEFDLKEDFLALVQKADWGRWADKSGKMHVAFLSNNDITGGNSGSPVFDKNGRVIGLAFDGNWEAMSGDIEFEPDLQRTISVDIRYVLFVIEQWGKCPRLIKELDLR